MGILAGIRQWNRRRQLGGMVGDVARVAFSGGEAQYLREAAIVHEIVGDACTFAEAKRILGRTKAMMIMSPDMPRATLVESMMRAHPILGRNTAYEICMELDGLIFSQGAVLPAQCPARLAEPEQRDVVVIKNKSRPDGISEEFAWMTQRFGKRGSDWELITQSYETDRARSYDVIYVRTGSGEEFKVTFDITAFDRRGRGRDGEAPRSWEIDRLPDSKQQTPVASPKPWNRKR